VIGHTEPAGICGSGLIDAVAVLLETGILGEYGEILSGDESVSIAEPVRLTQKDIQEFQLAKAAIVTGIDLLLRRLSLDPADIASVCIAGAFGTYINPLNVVRTGMLEFPPDKIRQMGNTALIGAKMFLFSDPSETDPLLERISHVNLESEPEFQDRFVDHMRFRITD
jgi:uncharacterized 2Fe-2S/4Fe-4S cluster protein (DUF4445 family)